MSSYTSEQLKALLAGELTPEEERQLARDIELDAQLRVRLELISGSGMWAIGSAPVPDAPSSPKLDTAIERVVSAAMDARHEQTSAGEPCLLPEATDSYENFAVPGIRILREIGRGGMGVVYEGWDELVGRRVAVKRLLQVSTSASQAKERLLLEARAAGALQHPNIVSIYGVLLQDDLPVLVQQFIDGETLQSRIDAKRYLSWQECVKFTQQIAAGLEAAHAAGIVHRDLKPDNILIDAKSQAACIADFGIAQHRSTARLTVADNVAGTPAYMSPEQTTGEPVDARSDLFSLGSVLVAAATGRPPFGRDNPFMVMDRIRTQDHVSLKTLRPDYPDWLSEVVDRLLIKDLTQRTQSAGELASSLADQSARSVRPRQAWASGKRLALAIVLLALLTGMGFWLTRPGADRIQQAISSPAAEKPERVEFVPVKPVWIRRTQSEFDSLAEAVQAATDGDTIEIGSDLECKPIEIEAKNLTLKGAASTRPVLRSSERSDPSQATYAYFIRSDRDLSLEGIEIDWQTAAEGAFIDKRRANAVVSTTPGARLTIRDCSIARSAEGVCLAAGGNLVAQRATIRSEGAAIMWLCHHSRASLEHCVIDGRIGVGLLYPVENATVFQRSQLTIRNSTLRTEDAVSALVARRPERVVEIEIDDSVLDAAHTVSLISFSNFIGEQLEAQPELWLKTCLSWRESRCVHEADCQHLVTRRFLTIERYSDSHVSSLTQWLSLVSSQPNSPKFQSIEAVLKPVSVGQDGADCPRYEYDSTSQQPLPDWIKQVGPVMTSHSSP